MSSDQVFSTGDLRSHAQEYKRDAAHKHKWALGATDGVGRADGKPRPQRPAETHYNYSRRMRGAAVASLHNGAKVGRNNELREGATSSDSSESNSDDGFGIPSPAADPNAIYSFDAIRSPGQGSQILNAALAKAVEKFEEKETTRLVSQEYDVLNSEGETVEVSSGKKGKGKKKAVATVPDADDDYEFL